MRVYLTIIGILFAYPVGANEYMCRYVDYKWTWFSDHVAISVNYLAIGENNRTYEIATGPSIAGRKFGWKKKYSGIANFSAWGLGAVHIRQADDGPSFKICVTAKDISPITIYKREF